MWEKYPEKCPNALALSKWSVEFSKWISSMIIQQTKLNARVKFLKKIISVMQELYNIKNYNAANEVLKGINSSAILRLKQTWNVLISFINLLEATQEEKCQVHFNFRADTR